jgi:hypothetical protein
MKMRELHLSVGEECLDPPGCRAVHYALTITDERGTTSQIDHESVVFDDLLGDSEQIPWVIAHTIRGLLLGADQQIGPKRVV